jgi:hypothetical protein
MIAAKRGLAYLSDKLFTDGHLRHEVLAHSEFGWCSGLEGISLVFLKGYETFSEAKYLLGAEALLNVRKAGYLISNLSQCHGLSGLGEVYLEAYRVTGADGWLVKAKTVAENIRLLSFKPDAEKVYWLVEDPMAPYADFMTGNSGVLHFFIRLCYAEQVLFPFL